MKKWLIVAGLLIVISGSAYLLLRKKKDESDESSSGSGDTSVDRSGVGSTTSETTKLSNFDALKKNIGSGYTNLRDGSAIRVDFNKNKNFAYFYKNNRVAIFTTSNNKLLTKGSYANGGKKIVLDNGKNIESSSVWVNLNKMI